MYNIEKWCAKAIIYVLAAMVDTVISHQGKQNGLGFWSY